MDVGTAYLEDVRAMARSYRALAERAMAQVDDEAFFASAGEEENSIAVLVKHMAGNLRSRWTDFLATDGEKPDRHRDAEFELGPADRREALLAAWEHGWGVFLAALDRLAPDDLGRTIRIRGEPHTVLRAVQRSLAHAAYHAGQIVLLAKAAAGARWETLSIARGASEAFTRGLRGG